VDIRAQAGVGGATSFTGIAPQLVMCGSAVVANAVSDHGSRALTFVTRFITRYSKDRAVGVSSRDVRRTNRHSTRLPGDPGRWIGRFCSSTIRKGSLPGRERHGKLFRDAPIVRWKRRSTGAHPRTRSQYGNVGRLRIARCTTTKELAEQREDSPERGSVCAFGIGSSPYRSSSRSS